MVIKPSGQGSAIGVSRLPDSNQIDLCLGEALCLGKVIVEPFVVGKEITVGVLDLHGATAKAFPVIEIRTAPGEWYDAVNRYKAGASEHLVPAPLPAAVTADLQRIAVAAHRALGLRHLSRADFILGDDGGIHLLEVNSLPGMTPTSLYPDGARAAGLAFPQLLDALNPQRHRRWLKAVCRRQRATVAVKPGTLTKCEEARRGRLLAGRPWPLAATAALALPGGAGLREWRKSWRARAFRHQRCGDLYRS